MEDSPRLSKAVRSMVQAKDLFINFLRCEIGNGQSALFWYNHWNELGHLLEFVGASDS